MSLAAAAPAGSPRPWPRPLERGGYGGPVGPGFLPTANGLRYLNVKSLTGNHVCPVITVEIDNNDYFVVRKMNSSSNPPATSVLKTDHQGPQKGQNTKAERRAIVKKNVAAQVIQFAWSAYRDKLLFQLLKHAVRAAEYYVSYEILKKVSPLEAKLIKDPSMKCKVRFRFGGEDFPPFILFKIFLHTEGHGCKYISGKNIMKSSNEAMVSACQMMGKKKFIEQILQDERLHQKFGVTDEIDIVTKKDYMRYTSLMDEMPAYFGGRNNYWRRLSLENFPRTTMIYDIVDYAESGTISNRLQKEMKYLSQRPKTEEMHQHQLQVVSEVRSPSSPSLIITPLYRPYKKESQVKHLGRRSKKAQMKVEKMRKAYKVDKEEDASPVTEPEKGTRRIKKQEIVISTPSFDIVRIEESTSNTEQEKEKKLFYVWSHDVVKSASS
ncbi:putative uncharacterized protein CXorf58 homolog [Orycteropus afer afer]|uniref:Uncharacterized protein n=1 Tax=Orycteropus afer afer TaxID=1230840 RepID=A0A8B7B5W1_ORYAF|nr:putative uncharacterized protein CXorf58 homolog [Orycteropus afer afer]